MLRKIPLKTLEFHHKILLATLNFTILPEVAKLSLRKNIQSILENLRYKIIKYQIVPKYMYKVI